MPLIRQPGERLPLAVQLNPGLAQDVDVVHEIAQGGQRKEHSAQEPHGGCVADAFHALFPRRRIAHRADDCRGGIQRNQLRDQARARGVRRGDVAVQPAGHEAADETGIGVVTGRPVREYLDPGSDFDFRAHGGLSAAVVDGAIEKDLQRAAEGGGPGTGESGADDLE